jgi:hypothetical protein
MLLYDWLRTVAAALNDDEPGRPFHRYPLKDVVSYYNAAMTLIGKYRSEDFIEYTKVKLQAGKYQDARQCCSNVLDITDQIDANGNVIKTLDKTVKTKIKNWRKPSCLGAAALANSGGTYIMLTTTIDKQMNGQFQVDPAVPCDEDVYVMVKCVRRQCAHTAESAATASIQDGGIHHTAAWHYILAMLLTGDRHAGSADSTSVIHYKLFFEILGVVMKQEDALENAK